MEALRDLSLIEIFAYDDTRGCAEVGKDEGNLILLNKLARLLEGLRGRGTIVDIDEVDLAPIDAALIVDHRQIGSLRHAMPMAR